MDAPWWEALVRFATFGASIFAFVSVLRLWRIHLSARDPQRYLTTVMMGVTGALAIDRAYVLWVGLMNDETGAWAREVEPFIRSIGAALLFVLLLGVGATALYHVRRAKQR